MYMYSTNGIFDNLCVSWGVFFCHWFQEGTRRVVILGRGEVCRGGWGGEGRVKEEEGMGGEGRGGRGGEGRGGRGGEGRGGEGRGGEGEEGRGGEGGEVRGR